MSFKTFVAALACVASLAAPVTAAETAKEPRAAEAAKEPKAAPRHTYDQTKRLVDLAVVHLKKAGPEKAFADFNDPKGKWIADDLYIFVFDMKGVYKATGFKPERTGSDAWKMKDATGQMFVVQEIIKKARRDGEAMISYLWKNPATGKLENKTSYVVKAGDFVVGAGFYHQ